MTADKDTQADLGPWVKDFQEPWERKAANVFEFQFLRVYAIARARRKANGHASFQPGELGRIIFVVDKKGELKANPNVDRAVDEAIQRGWLDPESWTRCLIMNPGEATGPLGKKAAVCYVCSRRSS